MGSSTTELVDLSLGLNPLPQTCTRPPNYPDVNGYSAYGKLNGSPTLCGGLDSDGYVWDECYTYTRDEAEWKAVALLSEPKEYAAAAQINDKEMMITGKNFALNNVVYCLNTLGT